MTIFDKFLQGISPVLIQDQIFGIVTFTTSKQTFEKSTIRCLLNIFLIFSFLVYTIFYMHQIIFTITVRVIYKSTELIVAIASSSYIVSSWLQGLLRSDNFVKLLTEMVSFDQNLHNFGIEIDYGKQRRRALYEMLARYTISVIVTVYYCVIRVYLGGKNPNFEVMCVILQLFKLATCLQFVHLVATIKKRYTILNKNLKRLVVSDRRKSDREKFQILCNICEMHHHLGKIVKIFNETFGFLVLVMFAMSFVTIVVCFFYISAVVQAANFNWKRVTLPLVLGIPFIGDVVYICNVCYRTVEEANFAGELIHKIDTDDSDMIDEIEMFSLQIANGKVEFSAAQFFPIDHTLVFSIIGGVTTYIIILIQLSATLVTY